MPRVNRDRLYRTIQPVFPHCHGRRPMHPHRFRPQLEALEALVLPSNATPLTAEVGGRTMSRAGASRPGRRF
jgi:hypothetical protein